MSELLDPHRLETLERVQSLYGKHIKENDKIRLGVEGDPCSTYRSVEEAPTAKVNEILERSNNGFVRFRATLNTGEVKEFTNRSFDPDTAWEIAPDFLDEFADRVAKGGNGHMGEDTFRGEVQKLSKQVDDITKQLSDFMKDVSERVSGLEEEERRREFRGADDIEGIKESDTAFRETMASTIRALAGDTLRVARGEPIEFAHHMIDKYDKVIEERASYRGSERKKRSANFDEVLNNVVECDRLTDS